MALNKQIRSTLHLFVMHSIKCGSSTLWLLIGDKALALESFAIRITVHVSRLNVTELSKHRHQFDIICAFRKLLDEQVEEVALSVDAVLSASVKHNLNFLAIELELSILGDCHVCLVLVLELHVAEASRFAIRVLLQNA